MSTSWFDRKKLKSGLAAYPGCTESAHYQRTARLPARYGRPGNNCLETNERLDVGGLADICKLQNSLVEDAFLHSPGVSPPLLILTTTTSSWTIYLTGLAFVRRALDNILSPFPTDARPSQRLSRESRQHATRRGAQSHGFAG